MAGINSLTKLVMAISSSVLEAQEKIEAAQVANLMSYFKQKPGTKGFFPLTMEVHLPSLRQDAGPGATDLYQVPYLSVLPYNALRIKQFDVNFDVNFSALDDLKLSTAATEQNGTDAFSRASDLPNLAIDFGATKKSGNFTAHVHLALEGAELPEGAARLINELIKSNQTYMSSSPSPGANKPDGTSKSSSRRHHKKRRQVTNDSNDMDQ